MAINPDDINTLRVGQLPPNPFNLTDLIPHEIGTNLNQGTVQQLADTIVAYIGSIDSIAFNPITVSDGQTLPDSTNPEWILVGKGTFINVNGGADITTTEELNALVFNGIVWSLGVAIPIVVDPPAAMISQTVTEGVTNFSPSEDAVRTAIDAVTFLQAVGSFNYADEATQTTPISVSANTPTKLTNDGLGDFTNTGFAPYGVTSTYNTTTNQFDFSELSLGDWVCFRTDLFLDLVGTNTSYNLELRCAVGDTNAWSLVVHNGERKSTDGFQETHEFSVIMEYQFTIDNPAELWITTDASASVKVNGWQTKIVRKNINVIHVANDETKLDKDGYGGTAQDLQDEILALQFPDGLVSLVPPIQDGADITIAINYAIWNINSIQVTNASAFTTTITDATTGYYRTDVIVGNALGVLSKIEGTEDDTTAVKPTIPTGYIEILSINVFGDVIDNVIDLSQTYVTLSTEQTIKAKKIFQKNKRSGLVTIDDTGVTVTSKTALDTNANVKLVASNATAGLFTQTLKNESGTIALLSDITGGGGAVDSVNGQTGDVDLDTSDIDPTTDRNYITDAQAIVIGNTSGTNTGDQDLSGKEDLSNKTATISGNEASTSLYLNILGWVNGIKNSFIGVLSAKTSLVDADGIVIGDSADSSKTKIISWLNFKTLFKTVGGNSIFGSGDISTGGSGTDNVVIGTATLNDLRTLTFDVSSNSIGSRLADIKWYNKNADSFVKAMISAVTDTALSMGSLKFYTGASGADAVERMVLNSSGFLGVGTNNPAAVFTLKEVSGSAGVFELLGTSASNTVMVINNNNTSFNNSIIYVYTARGATTVFKMIDCRANGTQVFNVDGAGNLFSAGALKGTKMDLSLLGSYADDTAAAAGGVAVGFGYINSSTGALHRRLT